MSRLELKVPPVVVGFTVAALMWLAAALTPSLAVPQAWRTLAAAVLGVCSAAVIAAAVLAFASAHTTVDPTAPGRATRLVDAGVYRFTRNPMYLGMLLALLAVAALLANGVSLVLTVAFVLYMDRFQIGPEERMLRSLFGADYDGYVERVRRWI